MAERDLKLKFSGDASGLAKSTEQVKQNIKGIKSVAEGLRAGFQSFAAAKGIVNDLSEALNGNADAISSVIGNLGNMGATLAMVGKSLGVWGLIATAVVQVGSIVYSFWQKNKQMAKEAMDANKDYIKSVDTLKSSIKQMLDAFGDRVNTSNLERKLNDVDKLLEMGNDAIDEQIRKQQQLGNAGEVDLLNAQKTQREGDALIEKIAILKDELKSVQGVIPDGIEVLSERQKKLLDEALSNGIQSAKELARTLVEQPQNLQNLDDMSPEDKKKQIEEQQAALKAQQDAIAAIIRKKEKELELESQIKELRDKSARNLQQQDIERSRLAQNIDTSLPPDQGNDNISKQLDIVPEAMQYPTDELRRLGGIIGNGGFKSSMTEYEKASLDRQKQIEKFTEETAKNTRRIQSSTTLTLK